MDVDNYVFVINPADTCYGQKFVIRGVQTDFAGRITGYTVRASPVTSDNGQWRGYRPTDLYYTTEHGKIFTSQMQLV